MKGLPAVDPCTLIVGFRLRFIDGRPAAHAAFRLESLLNTPLLVGFPGFASKLWLANDRTGLYCGIYEWDGPARAEHYARSLWRVLGLGCEASSIGYQVLPGIRRDEYVSAPHHDLPPSNGGAWWQVVKAI